MSLHWNEAYQGKFVFIYIGVHWITSLLLFLLIENLLSFWTALGRQAGSDETGSNHEKRLPSKSNAREKRLHHVEARSEPENKTKTVKGKRHVCFIYQYKFQVKILIYSITMVYMKYNVYLLLKIAGVSTEICIL